MDCQKVHEELAFLFADCELDGDDLNDFNQHLARCPHCARRARFTTRFLSVIRIRSGRNRAPRELRTRIVAALTGDMGDYS